MLLFKIIKCAGVERVYGLFVRWNVNFHQLRGLQCLRDYRYDVRVLVNS